VRVQREHQARQVGERRDRELPDHHPVEPRGRVNGKQSDRHRVVPGQRVVPEEKPGQADCQGGPDRRQAGRPGRQAPQQQQRQCDKGQIDRDHHDGRELMPERRGDQLVKAVGTDDAIPAGEPVEVGRACQERERAHRDEPADRGRGEGGRLLAQHPGQRGREQQVVQHDVAGHPDRQPGSQRRGQGYPTVTGPGPQHHQAEEAEASGQHVEVAACHQ
jgi:hypothetical protein